MILYDLLSDPAVVEGLGERIGFAFAPSLFITVGSQPRALGTFSADRENA